jgi:chorismate mutase
MSLEEYRKKIDRVDREMIELLCRRFQIVEEIARLKNETGRAIVDPMREKGVLENCKKASRGRLDESFLESLMNLILSQSRKVQSKRGEETS